MRYFGGTGPETPAMELHQELVHRQNVLESQHGGLTRYGITEPDVLVHSLGRHTLVLVDESVQPGGAFKYLSSAASVETVPEDTSELVLWTAGNFGMTAGKAAQIRGLPVRAFVPDDLNPVKRVGMESADVTVVPAGDTVEAAAGPGRDYLATVAGAVLLHPYNNLWGIAGLRYMGAHVSQALQKLNANGEISLRQPTALRIGVGGGSGVTGIASQLYDEKVVGNLPDNVTLHGVRPRRVNDGQLNKRFDGLRVAVPGSNTAPFMEDRRFVQSLEVVGEPAVADGMRLLRKVSPTVGFESNSAIAVGAALQWAADHPTAPPRNLVAVLTGRNADPTDIAYFTSLPGYASSQEFQRRRESSARRVAAEVAGSLAASTIVNSYAIAPKPLYGAMLRRASA